MKTRLLSVLSLVVLTFMLSCQDNSKEQVSPVKRNRAASARRACVNTISYRFLYPDSDYGYSGDGCIVYNVRRGSTRQIKVLLSNTVGYGQDIAFRIQHTTNASISYSVASTTGGSVAFTPPTFVGDASYFVWTVNSMPAYTTYELTLDITGAVNGDNAENGVYLLFDQGTPCSAPFNFDCDADDNLRLVLID